LIMAFKIFNTLTRKKEDFKPIKGKTVRMYTCGPTVYNFAHIGNLRTYMFEDLLRRYLDYKGFSVKQVMNLTDVDDKTIRDSQKEKIPLKNFTEKYIQAFYEDLAKLRIEKAEVYPKATEHIDEMVQIIKVLLDKGFAYKADDGSIYFSIKKFKDYGKLAHINTDDLKAGARVKHDEYEKDNLADFALWKNWSKDDGDVFWETELGKGRPGWHIECSAMSMKHLSNAFKKKTFDPDGFSTIDIHTGGVDNMFPHHEDEIAQSEAATGKDFVRYWMHSEHLIVGGKKMSKSLGNFYTLRDLIEKGHDPLAVRYVLLSIHYKQQLNFTFDSLNGAKKVIEKFHDVISKLGMADGEGIDFKAKIKKTRKMFEEALDDDLNISAALGAVFELVKEINTLLMENKISKANAKDIIAALENFDSIIGVMKRDENLDSGIEVLIKKRDEARVKKDWAMSDKIRDELKSKGIVLEDTPQGTIWKKT